MLERRERIRAFNEPTEGKEGESGEYGGSPSLGVPPAVLPYGEPPLLPQRRRVRVPRVRRVWELGLMPAGATDFGRNPR